MKSRACRKIGLGSVQFGLDYGISNASGKVPPDEVKRILRVAAGEGIELLDTASLYGDSESVLGQALSEGSQFRVVTKTCKISASKVTPDNVDDVSAAFDSSLRKLGHDSVYGLLVHDADDLLKDGGVRLLDWLQKTRSEGKVRNIGVSVYTAKQIDQILELFQPDLVQLPLNVLDQRLIRSGHLTRLKSLGVEIHARSVFLQGLLLMSENRLNSFFDPVREHLRRYLLSLNQAGISPVEAALGFALARDEIDAVIVGVCSRREMKEICSAASSNATSSFDFTRWAIRNENILNPARWNLEPTPDSEGVMV